jgi:hypothetical protein
MRTLRLGRAFDVVLVHDAIMYMTTEEELLAAAETAFAHTSRRRGAVCAGLRPGDFRGAHRAVLGKRRLPGAPVRNDDGKTDQVFLCRRP